MLPKVMYDVFRDMVKQREKRRWWMHLDRVLGARVDQGTWNKW